MSGATPLTVAELAAALDAIGGFEARPLVAIAVSGGPDSLALTILADRWARQRGGHAWALTVDHGLRPESAAEAATVGGWLAARSIPHEVLQWGGDKPAGGIQEAARAARYRLLGGWCRDHGCLHLLTAHHREDQAETYLIRKRAGSGVDGLAGMPTVREMPGCRLVRPLLGLPRARLVARLAAEKQPHLNDPSNLNPAFDRARLRSGPQALSSAGLQAASRAVLAYGRERIARETALHRLAGRAAAIHPAGFAALDAAALVGADGDFGEALLARVAGCIGTGRYPPRRERVARLRAALIATPDRARTLGGCRFVPWRGRVLVLRELAAAAAPVRVQPGEALCWDQRFAVTLPATSEGPFILGYLGQSGLAVPARGAAAVPRLLHRVLPALWDAQGLVAVPHLGYRRAGFGVLPRLDFRPRNPLATAGFTVV